MVNQFSEYSLTVDRSSRDNFQMAVLSFYKAAFRKPGKLKKCLTDAGALKKSFLRTAGVKSIIVCWRVKSGDEFLKRTFPLSSSSKLLA